MARTFAREGATVHLVGRTRAPLDAVAADIRAAGGTAEVAVVDALDEDGRRSPTPTPSPRGRRDRRLVQPDHRGDVQGQPLLDMAVDDLARPVENRAAQNFVTARAAARTWSRPAAA